ncbi:MAG: base excision DNA repair protein [Acidobacteriota bacterium]|nr:base excision DNA repair protein [Acidobacteriota bacterium]
MAAGDINKPVQERKRVDSKTRNTSSTRLRAMHDLLLAKYGEQRWWPARSQFEVILGAYLTQNTAWTSVERSLANLRAAGAMTVDGIRHAEIQELTEWIRPSGFHTRKAPAIKAFIELLDRNFKGSLAKMRRTPTAILRPQLLALPGVGPETADAILLYAFGHPVPVADEYFRRIADRHGLIPSKGVRLRYDDLTKLTDQAFAHEPKDKRAGQFNEFHALIVAVGKAHCSRTPDCAHCPLRYDLRRAHTDQQT